FATGGQVFAVWRRDGEPGPAALAVQRNPGGDRGYDRVPQSHGLIQATGGELASIGSEGHRRDAVGMALERGARLPSRRVPEPNDSAKPGRGQRAALWGKRQRPNLAAVSLERGPHGARG